MRALAKSLDSLLLEEGFPEGFTGDVWTQMLAQRAVEGALGKAFTNAGYNAAGYPSTDATPLRLENLDATMTSVLWTERHLKMWQAIPRIPSVQPVYQFNRRLSYGGGRSAAGFAEGGLPVGGVSSYQRFLETVKYMGVQGGITLQANMTSMLGGSQINFAEEEQRNRTIELLTKIERWFNFGLSTITDNAGNAVNYDGFLTRMGALGVGSGVVAPHNIMDLQGAALTNEYLEEAALRLHTQAYVDSVDGYLCFASPAVRTDLTKIRLGTGTNPVTIQRNQIGTNRTGVVDGLPMTGYETNYGTFLYESSIFLERTPQNRPLLAANEVLGLQLADQSAPPSPAAPTAVAANDATSLIPNNTSVFYVAAAFNDYGESLGVVSAAAVTTTGTQAVTVTIPRVTTGTCTGYRLYRTTTSNLAADANGVNSRWIADIPQPVSGNAVYVDKNQIVPGTGFLLLIRPDREDIGIVQMSPLLKWPLAIISTTIPFALMLFHTLTVKAPERHVVIKNIGRLQPGFAGG